jgi:hypothetical protein
MTTETNGVPPGLKRDGWWLDVPPPLVSTTGTKRRGIRLLAVLIVADLLFWDQAGVPALSLALFLAILALFAVDRPKVLAVVGLIFGLLPLVETVQALSLAFAIASVLGFVVFHVARGQAGPLWRQVLRFAPRMPAMAVRDAIVAVAGFTALTMDRTVQRQKLRALVLPLGLGMIFAALLAEANPVIQAWADRALNDFPDLSDLISRVFFCAGIAFVIWPCIAVAGQAFRLDPKAPKGAKETRRSLGIVTARSVTHSLMLFNAMFALQLGLDATYLWSESALPAGLSHAAYAHRGAYPLVVTALLAGGFALIAGPFARESRLLRGMLLLWVGQNVVLTLSALYRLDLYIVEYGLTYLRAHAAIWMVLVAIWLVMIALQVTQRNDKRWFVPGSFGLAIVTLYLCSFVNFAGLIADHNLTASRENRLPNGLDRYYVCKLGDHAYASMARHISLTGQDPCEDYGWINVLRPVPKGWRDWSFRAYRVAKAGEAHSLAADTAKADTAKAGEAKAGDAYSGR